MKNHEMDKIFNQLIKAFPELIIIFGCSPAIYSIYLNRLDFAQYYLIFLIPTLFAYFFIKKFNFQNLYFVTPIFLSQKKYHFYLLFSIIFILLMIIYRFFHFNSNLEDFFFLILFLIIGIQIFTNHFNAKIIIFELLIIILTKTYFVTTIPELYFGNTDLLFHFPFSEKIVISGSIISSNISPYAFFPLYHILIATYSLYTGLNCYSSYILITPIIYSISLVTQYCIFRHVTGNEQISLLCCLFLIMNKVVIFYSEYMIPRSLAFVEFLFLFLLLTYKYASHGKNEFTYIIPLLFMIQSVFLLLVHSITLALVIFIIGGLYFFNRLVKIEKNISIQYIFFLFIIYCAYLFFISSQFTVSILHTLSRIHSIETTVISVEKLDVMFFFMNNFPQSVLIFFSIIGLYCLIMTKNKIFIGLGFFSILGILISSPNPLRTIQYFSSFLMIDYFIILFAPFLAFIMSFGVYSFIHQLIIISNNKTRLPLIILCISIILYGSSINFFTATEKNPNRTFFNDDEIKGFNYINEFFPNNYSTMTDYYTSRYLLSSKSVLANTLPNIKFTNFKTDLIYEEYIIFPSRQFFNNGLSLFNGLSTFSFLPIEENIFFVKKSTENRFKIYSNLGLDIYF